MSSRLSDDVSLENSDPLDRLLLRVPLAAPDGWFAARTLARCRHSTPTPSLRFFARDRLWPRWTAGVFTVLVCAFTFQQLHHSKKVYSHRQENVQEAFEVMASLGRDSDAAAPAPDSSF